MITYDYSCDDCELTVEVQHSIKEVPKIKCPECEAVMRREFGISNYFIIKSGETFLGDVWDKQGVNFRDPKYTKKANAYRTEKKMFKLTKEERKEADSKSIRKTGKPWKIDFLMAWMLVRLKMVI